MTAALLLLSAVVVSSTPAGAPTPGGAAYFRDRSAADLAFAEQRYAAAESLYARIAERGQDVWVWFRLGQARSRLKRYREAADAFRRAVPFGTRRSAEGSPTFMEYRVARCYALAGERDSAFAWLDRTLAHGYEDRGDIAEDEHLASLHSDPRFERVAGRLSADLPRDDGWRYDLAYLVAEIRRVHVRYRHEQLPPGFDAAVRALERDIPRLADAQVFVRLHKPPVIVLTIVLVGKTVNRPFTNVML